MKRIYTAGAFVALLGAVFTGCSNSSTDPFRNRPRGLRISLNGATIVTVDGTNVEGSLHTHVGEYSGQYIIIPVTSEGHVIPTEQGYTLEGAVEDPAVATFVPVAGGAFEGEIVTHAEGTTTITFSVVRSGATGNLAYVAPPIDLIGVACSPPGSGTAAACTADAR